MMAPADDLDAIMAVMHCAFPPEFGEGWTRRQVEDALLMPSCHYGLAQNSSGQVCGFFLSRQVLDEEELLLLAVAPDHRRKGIGLTLVKRFALNAGLRGARRLLLEMRAGNPAEILYRDQGFQAVGTRPDYYRGADGRRYDAITFARNIAEQTMQRMLG